MFIQVPVSLPKSLTLKLLNPSYFNWACLDAKPTPSICKVSPYNFASPEPKTYPSGWVVMKRNLFLYTPSMHLRTYFKLSYPISVMFSFLLEISKLSFVIASILYLLAFLLLPFLSIFLPAPPFWPIVDLGMDFPPAVLPLLVDVCFIILANMKWMG